MDRSGIQLFLLLLCRVFAKRTAGSKWVAAIESEFFPSPLGATPPPWVPKMVVNLKKMRVMIDKVKVKIAIYSFR